MQISVIISLKLLSDWKTGLNEVQLIIMKVIKAIVIAFATYSRIPMPRINMTDKDMKYVPSMFPLVGVIIAALELGWFYICARFELGAVSKSAMAVAVPFIVTGGFHLDGFMDLSDALNSFKSPEERLEILKDPHIGAFAVIRTIILVLIFVSAVAQITDPREIILFASCFVYSRLFSSFGLLVLKSAKNKGSLYYTSSNADKNANLIILLLEFIVITAALLWYAGIYSLVIPALSIIYFLIYKNKMYKALGGITGDTAGYFVTVVECLCSVGVAILQLVLHFCF